MDNQPKNPPDLHTRVSEELNRRESVEKSEKADKKDIKMIKNVAKSVKKPSAKNYSKAVIEIALKQV